MICVTCRDVEFIDRCARFCGSEHRTYRLQEADLLPEVQIRRAFEIVTTGNPDAYDGGRTNEEKKGDE